MGKQITVIARAKAKHNKVEWDEKRKAYKVWVTTAPEKGKANDAIKKALAEFLSLSPSQIKLISGETGKQKRFLLP